MILLHGTGGGRQTNWATLVPVLANAGYCVFAPTHGTILNAWPLSAIGGLAPDVDSAAQVGTFINRVMAATGASQIDIVAHSPGTEVGTYWMKYFGGKGKVSHYISLSPYWAGGPVDDSEAVAAYETELGALDPADAPTVPCVPVSPITGG